MLKSAISISLALLCLWTAPGWSQDDAVARKARSIAILTAEGVPVLDSLPLIESEGVAYRRSQDEVVARAIALAIVAVKGSYGDAQLSQGMVKTFGAAAAFTPLEQDFMSDTAADDVSRANMSWRFESAYVLLWALGFFDDIGRPDHVVTHDTILGLIDDLGPEGLRAKAKLRPQSEILDAADLLYRYHWATVDYRLNGLPPPAGLDADVIMERDWALRWLVGYMDQEWDDITLDT